MQTKGTTLKWSSNMRTLSRSCIPDIVGSVITKAASTPVIEAITGH